MNVVRYCLWLRVCSYSLWYASGDACGEYITLRTQQTGTVGKFNVSDVKVGHLNRLTDRCSIHNIMESCTISSNFNVIVCITWLLDAFITYNQPMSLTHDGYLLLADFKYYILSLVRRVFERWVMNVYACLKSNNIILQRVFQQNISNIRVQTPDVIIVSKIQRRNSIQVFFHNVLAGHLLSFTPPTQA